MRVLVAEDDPTSRKLLGRVLGQWGYDVTLTSDGAAAWRELQSEDSPQLAILDWMMPEMDGVELCRRIRGLDSQNPPYVILLTAREGKHDMVTGLDAGANDYLGKPFDRDELRARLEVGRRFAELNEKLIETQRSLEAIARTDPLTGALNRRAILERLSQEIVRAERERTSLGIGLVDIDHFKLINDAHGHRAGDRVLCDLVSRSLRAMRPYDGFGRFGGDEFLAIVPSAGHPDVCGVLERIRESIGGCSVEAEGDRVPVTVSIAGAMWAGQSAEEALHEADGALYEAKAQGRDRVVMA